MHYTFKNTQKLFFFILTVLISFLATNISHANTLNTPVGMWTTIDDETGKPKSIVEITESNGVLSGKIIQLLDPSKVNSVCSKCRGDLKDQPINGMQIIQGLTKQGEKWSGGTILDPKKGKTYKVILRLSDDMKTLTVRGYVGIPSLGRTQTWLRQS